MNKDQALICPICTLYLHEGVSLGEHLSTHSKEKVVELLWDVEEDCLGNAAVIETKGNPTHKMDIHQIEIETTLTASANQPSGCPGNGQNHVDDMAATCSYIYGTKSPQNDCDTTYGNSYDKDCDVDSTGSDYFNENFENILIVIILVAVIILYLKM